MRAQLAPSLDTIIRTVASACGARPLDVRSDRRTAHVVLARHTGMYLARRATLMSYPAIGRAFGRRDHSTVMYAIRRIERNMEEDPGFAEQVLALERMIGEGEE